MDEEAIWRCAEEIPTEWYGETSDMERLVEALLKRRARVPELILDSRIRCGTRFRTGGKR